MKKFHFKATTLSIAMTIILLVLGGLIIGGFYYAQDWLRGLSGTSTQSATSVVTDTTIPNQPQNNTTAQDAVSFKSTALVSSKSDYQTKIQQDLNKYASETGVTIKDYSTTQAPSNITATPLINGVEANYVKITLENPVTFTNLIKFIKAIETNIPKMKITGINLSRANNSGDSIKVDPIIIEVYTR
jgi:hypothetical protein